MIRLSIIIIEYHCMDLVDGCIRSIRNYLGDADVETIVVSNSEYSNEKISEYRASLDGVNLIRAKKNLGYAAGVNVGLAIARGVYSYILNPDCLLTDANIYLIIEEMEKVPAWAITGPKVVDQNHQVQPSCRRFPRPWTFLMVRSVLSLLPGSALERDRYLMLEFDHEETRAVDWVSGGAIVVKMEALAVIGGLDERYFLYMEDVDWCRACWSKECKVLYCPCSIVVHAGQHQSIKGGMNRFFSIHMWLHLRSMAKYFLKHGLYTAVAHDVH